MVAKITCPTTVRRALNYNEQKVQQGKAVCIHAGNYLKDADQMNFHEKLARFQRNIELSKATTNTLHISLNFDPSDNIDTEKMLRVANDYMRKIGFGNQPSLVYEHHDAGHKHCHIVTTNIKDNGKRIDTYNIGKKVSEPARRAIESDYGLIKADGRKQQQRMKETEPAQKIQYGKSETKRSIANVIDAVVEKYKFSSLAELNAVLRLYNVEADRGKEGSRTHEKRGLNYRIIDEQGNKIGVPIKASSIYSKPTLTNLEKRFTQNEQAKTPDDKKALKTTIDWTLAQKTSSLKDFIDRLSQEKVDVVLRQNNKGQVYGLTYVDHNTKTVFNGSELGKQYSAKGIQEQLNADSHKEPEQTPRKESDKAEDQKEKRPKTQELPKQTELPFSPAKYNEKEEEISSPSGKAASFSLIENLMQSENGNAAINWDLLEEEKRKRRKSLDLDQEHEM